MHNAADGSVVVGEGRNAGEQQCWNEKDRGALHFACLGAWVCRIRRGTVCGDFHFRSVQLVAVLMGVNDDPVSNYKLFRRGRGAALQE